MPYYVFAWTASISYGLAVIVSKLSTKHQITNPWLFNFIWTLLIALFTVVIALLNNAGLPARWDSVLFAGFFSALTGTLFILALSVIDVSVLNPLYSFRIPITLLFGMTFFHESVNTTQAILMALITVAAFFVSMDEHLQFRSFFTRRTALALSAVGTSALYNVTVKNALVGNGFWEVNLWTNLLTVVFLLITVPLFWKDIKQMKLSYAVGPFWSSLFTAVGSIASFKAFQGNISIATAILSLPFSMMFAFVLSVIAPKLLEKHTLKVYAIRFVAAGAMVWAAIQLSR